MDTASRRIAILGSTGSIGRQTLDVIRALPERFRVVGLAAGRNSDLLAQQVAEFQPRLVSCQSNQALQPPASAEYEVLSIEDMARHPEVDTVVIATSGKAGLTPTLAAVKEGKTVCLANKEALVMAGRIVCGEAARQGARILPIDSEHSAIWQCLNGEKEQPNRLILTASGGPFRNYSPAQLKGVTVEQALQHPSWQMGPKVTIDSATLMNKGLEIIEAHWLFGMPFDRIEVLVHPQSIVHSMVEFTDGSVKAQLSCPDMRLPIQYALSYPERWPNPQLPQLDWDCISKLDFEPPDYDNIPCLKLAIEAGTMGETYPAVLCGADEMAVEMFLYHRIGFVDIARCVERTLEQHQAIANPTLEEILAADAWARDKVQQIMEGNAG
ncbi:1-deoxy-D-xylulose-5-phosphate reductoisomerase [Chloroflexota bacterium]